jgi:segregation and condensation protein B
VKEIPELKRIIEAALLASAQPLTLPQISGLFDELEMPPHDDLARALGQLQDDCAERGIELVEVASGFRYQVRQDVHAFVSRLWSERASRYSRALLETLSLIAYRQPITRAEIEQIRGVAVSTNIVRTLEEREWVRVVGYRDLPGKPALFGTTKQFLDYFNLKSLDELPPLSELRDIEEMDPQLEFDADRRVIAAIAGLPEDEAAEESESADRSEATIADIETMPAPTAHAEDTPETPDATADAAGATSPSIDAEHPTGAAENDAPESVT